MSTNLSAHPIRRALNWGATDRETTEALPGDELLPHGRSVTNALDISAPPSDVWPWIAQIGRGRAGFYTYTWIENLLGADIHNLDHIDPALQHLQEGDRIWLTPPRYLGQPGQFWTVKIVDPMRALVLEQRPPDNPTTGTWSLVLQPRNGATRLLNRHRDHPPTTFPMRAWTTTMMAGNLVMETKMLKTIAKRSAPPASQLSTFRSAEGKRRYLDAYQKVLEEWPVPFEELMVPTAFGDTHVLVSGEPGAAPVVLLHATGTSATGWLKNVGPLSQHHRVFAVDIIGEAGRSRQTALLRDRHDCVTWIASLLDQLGLDRASFVGWSFGGWATLAFLIAEPDRVNKCVLLAPYASLAPYTLPVLLFLKLAPYLPMGPPGRLALRMMAPGYRFDERFAEQFVLGGRYFKAADPKASVFPQPYSDEELRSISRPATGRPFDLTKNTEGSAILRGAAVESGGRSSGRPRRVGRWLLLRATDDSNRSWCSSSSPSRGHGAGGGQLRSPGPGPLSHRACCCTCWACLVHSSEPSGWCTAANGSTGAGSCGASTTPAASPFAGGWPFSPWRRDPLLSAP